MSDLITRTAAKDAIQRSGYPLENRIESVLEERGYYVEPNVVYPDPITKISREVDLRAISAIEVGPREGDFLFPYLFVECVNNPQPLVLFTRERIGGFLNISEIALAGIPAKIREESGDWVHLLDYLGAEEWHHCAEPRFATQFCSFTIKRSGPDKGQWMASHDDQHFEAFKKLIDITHLSSDQHFREFNVTKDEDINLEIYNPVVILQGDLWEATVDEKSLSLRKRNHLLYRGSYVGNDDSDGHQFIDVLVESELPRYLGTIEDEAKKIRRLMLRRRDAVRNSIDLISHSAHRLRSPEKIKDALDF